MSKDTGNIPAEHIQHMKAAAEAMRRGDRRTAIKHNRIARRIKQKWRQKQREGGRDG